MELVDDSDNRVIDGHKPRLQQHRRLAPAFVIHHLFGPSHTRGIARDNRLALRVSLFVEWLNPEHGHTFESRVHDARRKRADDLAQQHYDASSPSSSCNFASL